ncbi:MAG: tetratricopeptide repeat protein [Gemmatimonadota bacterium]
MRATVAAFWVLTALAGPVAAQLPAAENAFDRGDYRLARQLYDSILKTDSLNPRALYRLAVLDSWDGKLDLALGRFVKLRRVQPADPAIMAEHAKVLSWARLFRWSAALYDSVLALAPDRLDAQVGRARAVAWDGDLVRAERLWREALKRHPDDPDILIGLAQTLSWEGQTFLAEGFATRARQLAPNDQTARELFARLRAANRGPVFSLSTDGADDRYHNRFVVFTGAFSASPRSDLRGTLQATWRENEDGVPSTVARTARSTGFEGSVVKSLRSGASLRAGLGVRRLGGDSARTRPTAQLGGAIGVAQTASINATYRHYPFDETAALVQSGLVWDELQVNAEISPQATFGLSALANAAWLSDGNQRLIGTGGVMVGVAKRLRAGVYARIMGWSHPNLGQNLYFSPGLFTLGEARASYVWWRGGWWLRTTGGLGAQHVQSRATQPEWHGDLTVAYNWRYVDELAFVATFTNSAEARTATATTPTYRYWSVGLRFQRGL